jgi:hypothetical protein
MKNYKGGIAVTVAALMAVSLMVVGCSKKADNKIADSKDSRREIIVAVPEVEMIGGNMNPSVLITLRGAIISGFLENKKINRVVDTGQIDRILKQHNFETSDWSDPDKVAEIGKALNTNTIALATVYFIPKNGFGGKDKYTVTLSLLNVNTMEIVAASTTNVEDTANYGKIVGKMKVR